MIIIQPATTAAGVNTALSNLTATLINTSLRFNPGGTYHIGVGVGQTSGTDYRPLKIFVKDAVVIGSLGNSPATGVYGANNGLVTGAILVGNQAASQPGVGANTFWNSVALGYLAFGKDGGGANAPAFINLDNVSDQNVYFSLLHRTSARADYLKFGAGDLTFMQASGANLLWDTEGSGRVGQLGANRPLGINASSYLNIGNAAIAGNQSEGFYDGFMLVGNAPADQPTGSPSVTFFAGSAGASLSSGYNPQAGFQYQYGDLSIKSTYLQFITPSNVAYLQDGDMEIVQNFNTLSDPTNSLMRWRVTGDVSVPNGRLLAVGGLGVGNSASATTPGSVVKKIEVFDASGTSLGFVPVYSSIT